MAPLPLRLAPLVKQTVRIGAVLVLTIIAGCDRPDDPPTAPILQPIAMPSINGPAVQISSGGAHACALDSSGDVACWGLSDRGQAASKTGTFLQVSAGSSTTCAIRADLTISCWGNTLVGSPGSGPFQRVSVGDSHACALRQDGILVCWGSSGFGPTTPPSGAFTQIDVGSHHSCALRQDGAVLCWGWNLAGQVDGDDTSPASSVALHTHSGPFKAVSAGVLHTCAIRIDDAIVCWGSNERGQVTGTPGGVFPAATAPTVHAGTYAKVSTGQSTCAIDLSDSLTCWGGGSVFSEQPPPGGYDDVSNGSNFVCGIREDGSVVCFGSTTFYGAGMLPIEAQHISAGNAFVCAITVSGELKCSGTESVANQPLPQGPFTRVAAATFHACVLRADQSIACWGRNLEGQLNVPPGTYIDVEAGVFHSCGLRADATIACWGSNVWDRITSPAGTFSDLSIGWDHTCALRSDGAAVCWGLDLYGAVSGVEGTVSRTSVHPGPYTQVRAGTTHSCAVELDGDIECWGRNDWGQVTSPRNTSAPFSTTAVHPGPFIAVATGYAFTCAMRPDHTLTCWGSQGNVDTGYEVLNPPAGAYSQIDADARIACGIKLNGIAECWGNLSQTSQEGVGSGLTGTGVNVSVFPIDASTGLPAPTSITFGNVTAPGTTTFESHPVGSGGVTGPAGFRLGAPPVYYEISTTATFTGVATVCINYGASQFSNESSLRLLHRETDGSWTDVTTSLDVVANTICGGVTSFSPFLVASPNAAPVVTSLTLPTAPVPVGTGVSLSATFTDADAGDVHTATIDWDGTVDAGSVSESQGAGSVSAVRTFTVPGVYGVSVTVSDGSATTSYPANGTQQFVVVYDPSAGFVTGSGWVMSPLGAYGADPRLTGKASFGFVAKYTKGANVPTGDTEFQFLTAAFRFSSTTYQWLVVSGARAQFKGEGRINGQAGYSFMLTVTDGQLNGGGGLDKFRIKIWRSDTGEIVYDNVPTGGVTLETANPQAISGGSITIHSK